MGIQVDQGNKSSRCGGTNKVGQQIFEVIVKMRSKFDSSKRSRCTSLQSPVERTRSSHS